MNRRGRRARVEGREKRGIDEERKREYKGREEKGEETTGAPIWSRDSRNSRERGIAIVARIREKDYASSKPIARRVDAPSRALRLLPHDCINPRREYPAIIGDAGSHQIHDPTSNFERQVETSRSSVRTIRSVDDQLNAHAVDESEVIT